MEILQSSHDNMNESNSIVPNSNRIRRYKWKENDDLIDHFNLLATFYYLLDDKKRAKIFRNIGRIIKSVDLTKTDLNNVIGIGPHTIKEINQFLEQGDNTDRMLQILRKLKENDNELVATLELFTSIYGIDCKTAYKFYKLGYRSISDLHEDKYNALTHAQRISIMYFHDLNVPIINKEIEAIEWILSQALEIRPLIGGQITDKFSWILCGSFRRGRDRSKTISILCCNGVLSDFVEKLNDCELLVAVISQTLTEFVGICRLSQDRTGSGICHIIHIRFFESSEFPFAVLYYTGSKHFNAVVRQQAIRTGLSLSEYELRRIDSDTIVHVNSEEDIFRLIDLQFVPPQNRN